jgi:hypothetical protein
MGIFSEAHDCEKCRGKIVCIARDAFGNTYCAYCGKKVDYKPVSKKILDDIKKHTINNTLKGE